jgi:hypothetical protein
MASEESSKPSGVSQPGGYGTSLGDGRVNYDTSDNLRIYTARDQMSTLEDNDSLEARGDFVDSDVHTGKKCSMPEKKHI